MNISMIVAVNSENGIGYKGRIPWYLPEDLAHFKEHTTGKVIIMGRKTFDSLPAVLPDRIHIVVTNRPLDTTSSDVIPAASYQEAYFIAEGLTDPAGANAPEEVFVIGGASAYEAFWSVASKLYITRVHTPKEDTVQDVYLDLSRLETDFQLKGFALGTSSTGLEYTFELYGRRQEDAFL